LKLLTDITFISGTNKGKNKMQITAKQKEKALQEDISLFISYKYYSTRINDKWLKEIDAERQANIKTEPNGLVLDKNRTPLYWELRKRGDSLMKKQREMNETLNKMKMLTKLHRDLVREKCGYGYEGFKSLSDRDFKIAVELREMLGVS
jgi:hypothetical protein